MASVARLCANHVPSPAKPTETTDTTSDPAAIHTAASKGPSTFLDEATAASSHNVTSMGPLLYRTGTPSVIPVPWSHRSRPRTGTNRPACAA